MVKLLSLCLFFYSQFLCAATLKLELSNNSVEMGKSIMATFSYEGNNKPDYIDLALWHDDFYIEQADPDVTKTEINSFISITKARLYPRHTGAITLDAIALGGDFIKPRHIKVKPSIRNNIDATPQLTSIKSHYWADEPIIISINVPLHYARNEVIAKEWLNKGFTITPLLSIKTAKNVQLKWLIYTPFKGLYDLELPTIVQRGRGRFRYHAPKLSFTIKPLPAYLPSSVASGLITISSKINKNGDDKIAIITLQKSGYLPKDIEGFQRFINKLSQNELALNIQTQNSIKNGLNTREIKISLPKWLWNDNLNLKLDYFNTQTGRLESINHKLPAINTLPKSIHYIFIFISIILFLLTLKIMDKNRQQWRDKNKIKQQIQHAKNAHTLRLILLNNGQFKTLNDWANQIGNSNSIKLRDLINQACYQSSNELKLSNIKKLMLKPQKTTYLTGFLHHQHLV